MRHLVRRITYGDTAELVADVTATTVDAWLDDQLHPERIDDAACDAVVARFPTLGYSIATVRAEVEAERLQSWDVMYDLVAVAIARAFWSRRQLREVLVDVWSNLLAITCPSDEVWDNRHRYDADVIRRHAFGRYSDLLVAAVTHPAMLRYLNNADSTKADPNENLGREVLELHSVGVDAGYTEQDVRTSALILTGLSVDAATGEFRYRTGYHHVGPVQVMGFSHSNSSSDGRAVVEAYLRHLAAQPQTAQRVCRRLAVRFVADDPPQPLLDRMVAAYLAGDTAILPVLVELFGSAEFADSIDAKLRTPLESLAATARCLGLQPPSTGVEPMKAMIWMAGVVGQPPFGWPQPDGYPDVAAAWTSAGLTLARWNSSTALVADWWPSGYRRPELATFVPSPVPPTHGALVEAMALRLRQRAASGIERDAICAFLGVSASTPVISAGDNRSEVLTWRLEQVLALLLDAPTQVVR